MRFGQNGFTLLEVLTAMALTFMALGILLSGMVQMIRVADGAARSTVEARDQEMQLSWFRHSVGLSVLRSPVPGSRDDIPAMSGGPRSLSGLSLFVPGGGAAGPSEYRYILGFDPALGRSVLRLVSATSVSTSPSEQAGLITSWPGSEGSFRYLDEDDVWRDEWPPLGASGVARRGLPKAVQLVYGTPARSLIVAIHDRSMPPPTVKELAQ